MTGVYTWCCANSGPINQPIISSANNNNSINKHKSEQMWTVWRVIGERLNSELTPRPSEGQCLVITGSDRSIRHLLSTGEQFLLPAPPPDPVRGPES